MSGRSRCYNEMVTKTFTHHFAILQKQLIVANSSTNLLFLDRMTFCGILCYSSQGEMSVPSRALNFLLAFLKCLGDPLQPGHLLS